MFGKDTAQDHQFPCRDIFRFRQSFSQKLNMADQKNACHHAYQRDHQEDPEKHAIQPGDPLRALLRLCSGIKADIGAAEAEIHQIQIIDHGLHQLV